MNTPVLILSFYSCLNVSAILFSGLYCRGVNMVSYTGWRCVSEKLLGSSYFSQVSFSFFFLLCWMMNLYIAWCDCASATRQPEQAGGFFLQNAWTPGGKMLSVLAASRPRSSEWDVKSPQRCSGWLSCTGVEQKCHRDDLSWSGVVISSQMRYTGMGNVTHWGRLVQYWWAVSQTTLP